MVQNANKGNLLYNLKSFLDIKGISRKQLAIDVDISVKHIANIVTLTRGASMNLTQRIAKVLDISIDELMGVRNMQLTDYQLQLVDTVKDLTPDQIKVIISALRSLIDALHKRPKDNA